MIEWWWIPISLVLLVVCGRIVTLIALGVLQRWSRQTQNLMLVNEKNRHHTGLPESLSATRTTYWEHGEENVLRYQDSDESVQMGTVGRAPTAEEWRDLMGTTGASPSGVSYDFEDSKFVKNKRSKAKGLGKVHHPFAWLRRGRR